MGQSNQNMLSNQQSLSAMFLLKGKSKQYNLTYLQHLHDHKPYIVREATHNIEKQQLQAIAQIKQRQHFNSPHLTNLIRRSANIQDTRLPKRKDYALNILDYSHSGNTPGRHSPNRITNVLYPKNSTTHNKSAYCSDKYLKVCQSYKGTEYLTNHSHPKRFQSNNHSNLEQWIQFVCVCTPIYNKFITNAAQKMYISPLSNATQSIYRISLKMLQIHTEKMSSQLVCLYCSLGSCRGKMIAMKKIVLESIGRNSISTSNVLKNVMALNQKPQLAQCLLRRKPKEQIDNRQLRVSQIPTNIQRVSVMQQPIKTLVQQPVPLIARTSYSPQAVRSTFVPILNQTVHNVSPTRVIRQISPNRLVSRRQQSQMRGSYIFSYQKNPQQIIETNPPRVSLPVQNHTVVYQNRINTVNQVIPVTYTTYHAKDSVLVQQINTKTTKQSPPTHKQTQQSDFKINSPTVLQSNHKPLASFELNQLEPVYVIEQFKNGSKYQGYKYKGKRQGWGKYQYQQGGYYEGQWKNDLMSGKGKLYYQSGKIAYDGHLEQDLFHGSGTLYNEMPQTSTSNFDYKNFEEIEEYWIKYQGQFRNDKKEGHGLLLLTNGQSFEGSFHDDKVQGEGVYRKVQGREIRGIWHQNKLQRQL